jgi:hypothetical protein
MIKIIDGSWRSLECDVCGEDVECLLRIGGDSDYDARWQDVCQDCLQDCQDAFSKALTERGLA